MVKNLNKENNSRLKKYETSLENLGEKISKSFGKFPIITKSENHLTGNREENTITGAKCKLYLVSPRSILDKVLLQPKNIEYELVLKLQYNDKAHRLEPSSLEAISHDPINGPDLKKKIDEIISQERTFSRIYKKD